MLTKERQQQILSYLSQHNTVTVQELSARLYASSSTIRRDLSELAELHPLYALYRNVARQLPPG